MSFNQNVDENWVEKRIDILYCDAVFNNDVSMIRACNTPLDYLLINEKLTKLDQVASKILNSRELSAYMHLRSGEANSCKHAGELSGLSKMAVHRMIKKLSFNLKKVLDC